MRDILELLMRTLGLLLAWTATVFLPSPANAWNGTGHRVIAAIAYQHLTPKARARVDQLLRQHPDYATLLHEYSPADPSDAPGRALAAFLDASVWPDVIKGDRRFFDETRQDARPTAQLPGFPDMQRHTIWHYFDTPLSLDGTPTENQKPPHALSELPRLIKELKTPGAAASYDLPWVIHIEGDVHQPLHAVSLFLKSLPHGDAGGNRVFVTPGNNLHSLWDGALGQDTNTPSVLKLAAGIVAEHPPHGRPVKDPKKWIAESFRLSRTDVYTFGTETGSRERSVPLPAGYEDNMRRVARERAALAGYRLAAILNDKLK